MAENAFDRAFNKVLLHQNRSEEKARSGLPQSQAEREAEEAEALRSEAAPMSIDDAIKRMLLADKDKDYFRCNFGPFHDPLCQANLFQEVTVTVQSSLHCGSMRRLESCIKLRAWGWKVSVTVICRLHCMSAASRGGGCSQIKILLSVPCLNCQDLHKTLIHCGTW